MAYCEFEYVGQEHPIKFETKPPNNRNQFPDAKHRDTERPLKLKANV